MGVRLDRGLLGVTELVAPAAYTTTQTSAEVDLSLYRKLTIVIHAGTCTDGTFTPKLQTAAASGGSFSDDDGVLSAFTVISTSADAQVFEVDVDLAKVDNRYAQVVITAAGSPVTGVVASAVAVGELKTA